MHRAVRRDDHGHDGAGDVRSGLMRYELGRAALVVAERHHVADGRHPVDVPAGGRVAGLADHHRRRLLLRELQVGGRRGDVDELVLHGCRRAA